MPKHKFYSSLIAVYIIEDNPLLPQDSPNSIFIKDEPLDEKFDESVGHVKQHFEAIYFPPVATDVNQDFKTENIEPYNNTLACANDVAHVNENVTCEFEIVDVKMEAVEMNEDSENETDKDKAALAVSDSCTTDLQVVNNTVFCQFCPKTFKGRCKKRDLKVHIATVHEKVKAFKCDLCDKKFGHTSSLSAHKRFVHQKERNFDCNDCSKQFSRKHDLYVHVKAVHQKEKDFDCPNCNKKFSLKSYLNEHLNSIHQNEKNFTCNRCGKKFGRRTSLNSHVRFIHLKKVSLDCDKCTKKFVRKFDLNMHVKTVHENVRDYNCEKCGKSFYRQYYLNVHIRTVHEGARDFTCFECGKNFSGKGKLNLHMVSHQNINTYDCHDKVLI